MVGYELWVMGDELWVMGDELSVRVCSNKCVDYKFIKLTCYEREEI